MTDWVQTIDVRPIDGSIGALVHVPNLGATPIEPLRAALREHRVLVMRGHAIPTNAELAAFAAAFGELAPASKLYGIELPREDILLVSNELDERGHERGAAGSGTIPWHTDYSFMVRPAKETFLEAYRLPADGGPQTCFCDMYDALVTLPRALRSRLDGLVARHTLMAAAHYGTASSDPDEQSVRARQANPDLRYPDDGQGIAHPVVMRHPETGDEALYVSSFVDRFDGVAYDEGRALLDELLTHAAQAERIYCHDWQVGDLVIFDTIGTVHRRGHVAADAGRTMRQLSTLVP